jgi:hypothetical protein
LAYVLLEDIVNYRLYKTGPLLNGMWSRLRVITPGGQAGFLKRTPLKCRGRAEGKPPSFGTRILVPKEAALDLVRRCELPQFSW